jgi:hypothetical protein
MQTVFLSHNSLDKPLVRQVNAELALLGAETHFDELGVLNGEIISEWIDKALSRTDLFVLFWSAHAEHSTWVRDEWTAAHTKFREEPKRFLVVRLDNTPLPTLLQPKKWIDARTDTSSIARAILGLDSAVELLKAIQITLDSWEIRVESIPGVGPVVGCSNCGAGLESIKVSTATDYAHDDVYTDATCVQCGHIIGWGEL